VCFQKYNTLFIYLSDPWDSRKLVVNTLLLTGQAPPVRLCGPILCTVEGKVKRTNTFVVVYSGCYRPVCAYKLTMNKKETGYVKIRIITIFSVLLFLPKTLLEVQVYYLLLYFHTFVILHSIGL
jgi:hypothetical protein